MKAPSFVTDEGIILMNSSLILEHVGRLAAPGLNLAPNDLKAHARTQRIIGLALAACEKTVQIVYQTQPSPRGKATSALARPGQRQLAAACRLLEAEVQRANPWLFGERPLQADITSAVTFHFTREMLPEIIGIAAHPELAAFSA